MVRVVGAGLGEEEWCKMRLERPSHDQIMQGLEKPRKSELEDVMW